MIVVRRKIKVRGKIGVIDSSPKRQIILVTDKGYLPVEECHSSKFDEIDMFKDIEAYGLLEKRGREERLILHNYNPISTKASVSIVPASEFN